RRPRRHGALGEDLRVPCGRASDPRRRAAEGGGRRSRSPRRRGRCRASRRRGGPANRDQRAARALAGRGAERRRARTWAPRGTVARVRRAAAEHRVTARSRLADFLFLATIFSVSFQNVYWNVAGRVNLADVLALLFIVAFLADRISARDGRIPPTTVAVLAFA